MKPQEIKKIRFAMTPKKSGELLLKAKLSPIKDFKDKDLKNNTISGKFDIK